MLRQSKLPLVFEVPALDDDPAMFDPSPEWFVPGLKLSLEHATDQEDGLGLRSLLEEPEALSKAWRTAASRRRRPGLHRAERRSGRSRRDARAA